VGEAISAVPAAWRCPTLEAVHRGVFVEEAISAVPAAWRCRTLEAVNREALAGEATSFAVAVVVDAADDSLASCRIAATNLKPDRRRVSDPPSA
jgi:hypothetical protein